jgi:hypothetical protein
VGALAHFLRNRFYIGEVVYRGETHTGEHASIIDRPTFEAVQAKLAENARARRIRVENAPAILMGRIFDDRGNRMNGRRCRRPWAKRQRGNPSREGGRTTGHGRHCGGNLAQC